MNSVVGKACERTLTAEEKYLDFIGSRVPNDAFENVASGFLV